MVVIAAGPLLSLTMEVIGYATVPASVRAELSWTTLHAAVAFVFGICAIVAVRIRVAPMPIVLMALMAYLWIPQTFFAVIAHNGVAWPLLRSVELLWAVGLGMLALAYPRGHYPRGFPRTVFWLGIVVSLARIPVTLLFDRPSPGACGCATNVFALAGDTRLFGSFELAYRVFGAALMLAIAGWMLRVWSRSNAPTRSVAFVMPFGLLAWTASLIAESFAYASTGDTDGSTAFIVSSSSSGPLSVLSLFAVASIPICYIASSQHLRSMVARVAQLITIGRDGADTLTWRDSLRAVLDDPSLELFWWDDAAGGYRAPNGALVSSATMTDEERWLLVRGGDGRPIAAASHDPSIASNQRLREAVREALRLSIDNSDLRREVQRTLRELRESRRRILEAGDESRRRIERDLHDGSQQRLVALAMRLRGACDAAATRGEAETAADLESAIAELGVAMRELRELARGIHPSALSVGGLDAAIDELAARSPIPVAVSGEAGALPDTVEATAYFMVAEALANVAKHSGASRAWVRIERRSGVIGIVVRDDGVGGADAAAGTGLLGLIDRADAVHGTVEVTSVPGEGTTITAELPLAGSPGTGLA